MPTAAEVFFDTHWRAWLEENPPPVQWTGTEREWAELEMPCRGLLGRSLYWFSCHLCQDD